MTKQLIHSMKIIQIISRRKNQEDLDTEESPETEINGRYLNDIEKNI